MYFHFLHHFDLELGLVHLPFLSLTVVILTDRKKEWVRNELLF